MFRRFAVLLAVLLAAPALALTAALEGARAGATAARERVSALRTQQMALRGELNAVASRIEQLKAARGGKVLRGSELEQALRRSQELSGTLTELAQSVAGAEGEAQKQHLALLAALSQELAELRARFDATADRSARGALLTRLRAVRQEREQVRAALPAAALPALEAERPTDDPEDLLERADLLRDNEDKVRRELTALDARIREVREERELDRHLNDFIGEDQMFDESDRRARTRVPTPTGKGVSLAETPARGGFSNDTTGAPSGAPTGPAPLDPQSGSATPPVPGAPESSKSPDVPAAKTSPTGQPLLGQGRDVKLSPQDLDNLDVLELQKKRLLGLADELRKRAQQLEARAKDLK